MNINDMTNDTPFTDSWEPVFARQRELMAKYHKIEATNGLLETGRIPVDIDCRFGQARLKSFAWRTTEELGESWEAYAGGDLHHAREECADALHFIVEMCILAGIPPDQLSRPTGLFDDPDDPWLCVYRLGLACNCLKNKPWKQSHMPTDRAKFETLMHDAFLGLCSYAKFLDMDAEMFHDYYFKKSKVNQFRQESNY